MFDRTFARDGVDEVARLRVVAFAGAARAYLERTKTEGNSRREAIRCLKRLLIRVVFNTLKTSPALT
jgi:hypothetical protein